MRFGRRHKDSASSASSAEAALTPARPRREYKNAIRDPEKNPFLQRNLANPTTDLETLIHLAKGSFGTGVFAIPFAFANAGLVTGLVGSLVIGFICSHCVHILVKSAHELYWRHNIPALNFGGIAEVAFREGPEKTKKLAVVIKIIIQCFIMIIAIGVCSIFLVFVASNIAQVINFYTDSNIDIKLYILMVAVVATALAMIRDLRVLAPFSLLSNILVMASVVIVFIYIFDDLPSINEREAFMPAARLPIFFSIIVYSLEGINVVMPLENNMKTPNNFLGRFNVLNTALTMIVCLFTMVGFFGYLKYGEETEGSISLNLPEDQILAQSSKIMLSVAILLSHPLQFYCGVEFSWPKLAPMIGRKFPRFSGLLGEYIYRLCLILITVIIAVGIPNLGALIGIGGSVCLSTLGLMFPTTIETIVYWKNWGKWNWMLWKNILIFLFGMLVFITGFAGSILQLIVSFQGGDPEEGSLLSNLKQLSDSLF
ncbi:proton-coupled amino acid transporter-like protein pathetic [Neocloeon triangulifer]|uniref:proton-coupled amino acid transporter-like protein pathetic n=1 Tax=Neocloeon triangulifer TaxID=2078957 RepID=UPI00286F1679|nr:proton-coupled amino acid transporter-like protein pathetic [Neocloeon triangulifer]